MDKKKCHICRNEYEGHEEENGLVDENGRVIIIKFDLSKYLDEHNETLRREHWICCICYFIMFDIACDMKGQHKWFKRK